MNYKIIKNFLSQEEHNEISHCVNNLDFYYQKHVGKIGDNSTFFFSNMIYEPYKKPDLASKNWKIVIPLFYKGGIKNPYRVQVNCFIKQPIPIFTQIHTDQDRPHNVLLYAINSNNGYTILDPKGKNIKIPSIANQALFFEGNIEHQAVTQTDENVRFNININFH